MREDNKQKNIYLDGVEMGVLMCYHLLVSMKAKSGTIARQEVSKYEGGRLSRNLMKEWGSVMYAEGRYESLQDFSERMKERFGINLSNRRVTFSKKILEELCSTDEEFVKKYWLADYKEQVYSK